MSRYPSIQVNRAQRHEQASAVAVDHDGVAHRQSLRMVGVNRAEVRSEMRAGRWQSLGTHTVQIGNGGLSPLALHWRAVWESGSGAALDGAAALAASGLTGFDPDHIDVSLPHQCRGRRVEGVVIHRRRTMPPIRQAGLPRVCSEVALVHAMGWARTDRTAALLLCMVVQQRLVRPDGLLQAWSSRRRWMPEPRRGLVDHLIGDVVNGAQSLGELDLVECLRTRGLPEPDRQIVRTPPSGRIYLDLGWEAIGLFVEVDGGHHALSLNPVADALRQNDVVLGAAIVLRVPVMGLRLDAAAFITQIERAHALLTSRAA